MISDHINSLPNFDIRTKTKAKEKNRWNLNNERCWWRWIYEKNFLLTGSAADAKFTTECFFLTIHAQHISFMPALNRLKNRARQVKDLEREIARVCYFWFFYHIFNYFQCYACGIGRREGERNCCVYNNILYCSVRRSVDLSKCIYGILANSEKCRNNESWFFFISGEASAARSDRWAKEARVSVQNQAVRKY